MIIVTGSKELEYIESKKLKKKKIKVETGVSRSKNEETRIWRCCKKKCLVVISFFLQFFNIFYRWEGEKGREDGRVATTFYC